MKTHSSIKFASKLLLSIMYSLIFAEVFVRTFAPQPIIPRYIEDGGDGIRNNIPNMTYEQRTEETHAKIRINSQGIRANKTIQAIAKTGTTRIALLGDSFLMGYEVNLEDSIAWLLEEKLRKAGIEAEVVNLSVSGFGMAENLITLTERAPKFSPDIIVAEWHSSDFAENRRSQLFSVNNGHLTKKATSYLPGVEAQATLMKIPGYQWLMENSHLYSATREKIAIFTKKMLLNMATDARDKSSMNRKETQFIDSLDYILLNAVHEKALSMGARFLLLDIPDSTSRTTFKSTISSKLPEETAQNMNAVFLERAFSQYASESHKIYFEKGHGHLTPLGNNIAADALAAKIAAIVAN